VAGVRDAAPHLATYRRLNSALWAAAERGEIRSSQIRNVRFEQLAGAIGLDLDGDGVRAMADAFIAGLGHHGELYPGAREVLDALVEGASLAVISNGLGEVVYARLARLDLSDYFDAVVVSSEVGVAKPGAAIFDAAFERLGSPDRSTALMVGDSLSSDIAGGTAYGIDTCWFNPHRRPHADNDRFTYQIEDLHELVAIVGTGDGISS
jgi:2-haloacid dehalogenase